MKQLIVLALRVNYLAPCLCWPIAAVPRSECYGKRVKRGRCTCDVLNELSRRGNSIYERVAKASRFDEMQSSEKLVNPAALTYLLC